MARIRRQNIGYEQDHYRLTNRRTNNSAVDISRSHYCSCI